MEVCNKAVNALEFIARIDENIRPALAFLNFSVERCDRFKRAAACCSDRDYAAAVCLCFINKLGGFFR